MELFFGVTVSVLLGEFDSDWLLFLLREERVLYLYMHLHKRVHYAKRSPGSSVG